MSGLSRALASLGRIWARRGQVAKGLQAVNARRYLRRATRLGRRVTLRGRPHVINEGRITIGDRVRLDSTVATLELAAVAGGHL